MQGMQVEVILFQLLFPSLNFRTVVCLPLQLRGTTTSSTFKLNVAAKPFALRK